MKKLAFIFILFSFSFQSAFAAEEKINAGILPNIWYSSLKVYDGNSVGIFAGIQNHSDADLSGEVSLYIDGEKISTMSFSSPKESLVEVGDVWKAEGGSHRIQFKIEASSTDVLLSSETKEDLLTVEHEITLDDIKEGAVKVAENVLETIDNITSNLADSVETLKIPVDNTIRTFHITENKESVSVKATSSAVNSLVLQEGTSSDLKVLSGKERIWGIATIIDNLTGSQLGTRIYNFMIDVLSGALRHWKIALIVLVALILLMKMMFGRREED